MPIEIKQPIFGNWYIEEKIGNGSFGTVYKIKRETFGKTQYSAMKVIRIPQDKSEKKRLMSEGMDEESITGYYDQFVKDFSKEIELMAELQGNTNIVGYTDHIIEENEDGIGYTIYIRMEYLTPLDEYLISENTVKEMSLQEVIKLGVDICSALEICATKNIIHRDIKPDNIFVSENGDFELGDFGIARQLESTQSGLSKKGTYTYMAPEIYNGQAYNSTVDIYSLGIVLYRLLNKNRAPFLPLAPEPIKYTDKEKALVNRMKGEPIPAIQGVDEELNRIVIKACAFNPRERYQSVTEMKMELIAISEIPTLKAAVFSGISKGVIDKKVPSDEEDDELESTVGPFGDKFKESSTDTEKSKEAPSDNEDDDELENTVGPFDKRNEDTSQDADIEKLEEDSSEDALDKTISVFDDKSKDNEDKDKRITNAIVSILKRIPIIKKLVPFLMSAFDNAEPLVIKASDVTSDLIIKGKEVYSENKEKKQNKYNLSNEEIEALIKRKTRLKSEIWVLLFLQIAVIVATIATMILFIAVAEIPLLIAFIVMIIKYSNSNRRLKKALKLKAEEKQYD